MQFKYAPSRSNLKNGTLSMVDFVVLHLGNTGQTTVASLVESLASFRGQTIEAAVRSVKTLLNNYYGYKSASFTDVERTGAGRRDRPTRGSKYGKPAPTYFWCPAKGTVALNFDGMEKLVALRKRIAALAE